MNPRVTMETSKGTIELILYRDKVPKTVDNFVKLAKDGFYDDTRFHRVIPGFMIQGGDPNSRDGKNPSIWGMGGPGYKFEDELHKELKNTPGMISMANSGPNTNGSQFFINIGNNSWLDGKYSVFGKVTSGMDVVSEIVSVQRDSNDRPQEDVILKKVTVKEFSND